MDQVGYLFALSGYRAALTPLDRLAQDAILDNQSVRRAVKEARGLYVSGGVAFARYLTQNVVGRGAMEMANYATPRFDRRFREPFVGVLGSVVETVFAGNPVSLVRTRMMQRGRGQFLNVVRQLTLQDFRVSQMPAIVHRVTSSAIFWSVRSVFKDPMDRTIGHEMVVSSAAGLVQVVATSPSYAALKMSQSEGYAVKGTFRIICDLFQKRGLRGLCGRGLVPRLIHSVLTSGPVTWWKSFAFKEGE